MPIDYRKLGARIKSLRTNKNLTQEKLSDIIGIASKHLSKVETGAKYPSLELIVEISNALCVSSDDILIDSLDNSNSMVGNEIQEILLDCNHDEKEMLTRTLKFLKALLSEFGI